MTLIYLNTKFPRTKKAYTKAGDDNTDRLKQIMSKLTLQETKPEPVAVPMKTQTGGAVSKWAYTDRKKSPTTFKL